MLKKCKKPDDVLFINATEHFVKGKRQNQLSAENKLPCICHGPIVSLNPEVSDRYCRSASDADKRHLYDVLASGDERMIRAMIDRVTETVLDAAPGEAEPPGGAANVSQPIRPVTRRSPSGAASRR